MFSIYSEETGHIKSLKCGLLADKIAKVETMVTGINHFVLEDKEEIFFDYVYAVKETWNETSGNVVKMFRDRKNAVKFLDELLIKKKELSLQVYYFIVQYKLED